MTELTETFNRILSERESLWQARQIAIEDAEALKNSCPKLMPGAPSAPRRPDLISGSPQAQQLLAAVQREYAAMQELAGGIEQRKTRIASLENEIIRIRGRNRMMVGITVAAVVVVIIAILWLMR